MKELHARLIRCIRWLLIYRDFNGKWAGELGITVGCFTTNYNSIKMLSKLVNSPLCWVHVALSKEVKLMVHAHASTQVAANQYFQQVNNDISKKQEGKMLICKV